ncbi:hypothetical protein SPRG_14064 [Saprolegnia parasitica CBS 223.65]|uniref:Uncharacterized protein n=1 Tax=Saprolegnia parasitica (strain CBS 223.65) TaxID=695850 RepID=A0A067C329_SAPPC|nr:hypothetical protein SPRG_14064 [Saprolegnia parasitica CBS 223.65]KDO20971.1 hypothetical protein SPRG_14064 [Saprolegnia parasitica CBS 223.65]|eukprot:XP_012208361.1 hypothetical protein SPRG_14064 [Saprolegnia parasitica CBS 223.65]
MSVDLAPGVASSAFHVNFCSHETIFQAQYTRYQRARKVKVMRCFPHCCPCHVANRYCGMPLQLRTTLAPTPTPRTYASLLKIAPTDHESWALGAILPPQDGREGDDDDGATWYPGMEEALENNALGSSFNHSLVDGWTYGWKSGRSQSVRDRLHAATGFLFEVVLLASGSVAWHLIAKVTSPGFTVATYRNRGGGAPPMAPSSWPSSSLLLVPAPIRTMASDLGLVSYFLDTIEPSNAAAEAALVGHLLGDGSPPAPFDCVARCHGTPVSDEHEMAAALLAHLLEPAHVTQLRAYITTHEACVLAKATLRQAYSDGVELLHTLANDFLTRAFDTTLSLLASLVRQKHPAMDAAVQAQIGIEGRFGYRSVVAHFRESALSSPWGPLRANESALSGRWMFDPDASSIELASGATFSLWEATRWATWLYGCRLEHRGMTLHVTSDWQLYASAPAVFLLDNAPRLLRTFPNGESTMGGTGVVLDGDYVGHVTSAGDIYLECYRYHLLAACSSRLQLQLSVRDGNLCCSFKWYCIDGRLDPSLVVAAVAERRAVVWESASAPIVGCGDAVFVRRRVD